MYLQNYAICSSLLQVKLCLIITLSLISTGCNSEEAGIEDVPEVTILDTFTKVVTIDDNLLFAPSFLQLDTQGNLYAYDASVKQVQVLDSEESTLIRSVAGPGRGPGEIVMGNHFRLVDNQIHIIDTGQFMIHRYNQDGRFLSSIPYGEWGYFPSSAAPPPPPVNPNAVMTPDLNNKPHILANGNILLSPVGVNDTTATLFRSYNDDQQYLSEIGRIPEGSSLILKNEEVKDDILNNRVPSFYLPKAFAVSSTDDEELIYIIHSSIPKIARYQAPGNMLWEKELNGIAELDSIRIRFFSSMERLIQNDIRSRIPLNFYYSGIAGLNGELWLITQFRDIFLHRFSGNGTLLNRYKLVAGDETLKPIFAINFQKQQIYIVNNDGEILTYPY